MVACPPRGDLRRYLIQDGSIGPDEMEQIESHVELFLIGDPIHMSGAPSRQGEYTREFARELEYKTGLPVKFWDERWTSREAERTLRGSGIAHGERKPAIDRLSAVILLQSYLDSAEARQ